MRRNCRQGSFRNTTRNTTAHMGTWSSRQTASFLPAESCASNSFTVSVSICLSTSICCDSVLFFDSRWQALSETDEISFYQGGEDGVVDTGFNFLQICADASNSECDGYDLWRTLRCYQEKGTGTWWVGIVVTYRTMNDHVLLVLGFPSHVLSTKTDWAPRLVVTGLLPHCYLCAPKVVSLVKWQWRLHHWPVCSGWSVSTVYRMVLALIKFIPFLLGMKNLQDEITHNTKYTILNSVTWLRIFTVQDSISTSVEFWNSFVMADITKFVKI